MLSSVVVFYLIAVGGMALRTAPAASIAKRQLAESGYSVNGSAADCPGCAAMRLSGVTVGIGAGAGLGSALAKGQLAGLEQGLAIGAAASAAGPFASSMAGGDQQKEFVASAALGSAIGAGLGAAFKKPLGAGTGAAVGALSGASADAYYLWAETSGGTALDIIFNGLMDLSDGSTWEAPCCSECMDKPRRSKPLFGTSAIKRLPRPMKETVSNGQDLPPDHEYHAQGCAGKTTITRPISCYMADCHGFYLGKAYTGALGQAKNKFFWSKKSVFTQQLGKGRPPMNFGAMEDAFNEGDFGGTADAEYAGAVAEGRKTADNVLPMQWWMLQLADMLYKRDGVNLYLDWCDERATALNKAYVEANGVGTSWTPQHKQSIKDVLFDAAAESEGFVATREANDSEFCGAEEEGAAAHTENKEGNTLVISMPDYANSIKPALEKGTTHKHDPVLEKIYQALEPATEGMTVSQ